jgi:hypothetical protein
MRPFLTPFSVNTRKETQIMETATLVKVVRDPRSGEVHRPREQVDIVSVIRNLDRTLFKVRWQSGGDCMVFPDDIGEISQCQN